MYQRKVFDRYYTQQEEKRLFRTIRQYSSIQASRDHAWMQVLLHTGLRIESFARLTVADAKEALRSHHLKYIGKGNKPGSVYCNQTAHKYLRELLTIRSQQGHADLDDSPLVMSRHKTALSIRSYQLRMSHWCKLAEVPVGTPHWLRHTLAKRIMQNSTANDPRGVVQGVLNHSNPASTYVYTMPDKEELAQTLEEIA